MRVHWFGACSMMALALACSSDPAISEGAGGRSGATDAAAIDATADQGMGGGAGMGGGVSDSGSASEDVRDATLSDLGDSPVPDGVDGATSMDVRDSGSVPTDGAADASGDVDGALPADVGTDADAMTCKRPTLPDASADAGGRGVITNLTGYTASDVLYLTWSHPAGSVPRDRFLELRFDPSPGICSFTLAGQRSANATQLRIVLVRANFLMWGTLPSFFVPATYPLNENVYEQDAGIASVAEVNLVNTDAACRETYNEAKGGSVTLTSVTPSHVAGSFTATFDDAGTISGGFEVDLCFDAELPECPYTCTP